MVLISLEISTLEHYPHSTLDYIPIIFIMWVEILKTHYRPSSWWEGKLVLSGVRYFSLRPRTGLSV
jgi:hypothetical protein